MQATFDGNEFDPTDLDGDDTDRLKEIMTDETLPDRYRLLASYRLLAVTHRFAGRIRYAMDYETLIEKAYNALPENLKW